MLKAVAITMALMLAASTAAAAASAEQSVRELEERWLQNEDNPAVLRSILADDFVHVLPFGFVSKQEHINFVSKHPHPAGETRTFEELRVRVYGDTAIANGIVSTKEPGAAPPRRTIFTDVFVRRHGKWQAVNAQESPMPAGEKKAQ